jgi:hypothetical protein
MIVEIDLKPLKEFIINCVENLDYEVNFNFLFDESTKEVFMEILKGSSDMDSESIMDANKFSYLQGHTHFLSYSQKWEYSPPSASDYTTFLESY